MWSARHSLNNSLADPALERYARWLPRGFQESDDARTHRHFRAAPPARQRVADHVFESLARAILKGELKPGEPLATQRDLAKQFNVSALVVRQAIHRLEDLGLVRVRQGSTTIVLDPNESTDIRLIQLQMELAEPGPGLATAAIENWIAVPGADADAGRAPHHRARDRVLRYLIDNLSENADAGRRRSASAIEYWRQIAKATHNPLFQQQVRWWSTLVAGSRAARASSCARRAQARTSSSFARCSRALWPSARGAAQLWLDAIRPLLDWVDAQRGLVQAREGRHRALDLQPQKAAPLTSGGRAG